MKVVNSFTWGVKLEGFVQFINPVREKETDRWEQHTRKPINTVVIKQILFLTHSKILNCVNENYI